MTRPKPVDDTIWTEYDLERMSLDDSEPEDDLQTCGLCGNRYLAWPGHERCDSCGAGVKQP